MPVALVVVFVAFPSSLCINSRLELCVDSASTDNCTWDGMYCWWRNVLESLLSPSASVHTSFCTGGSGAKRKEKDRNIPNRTGD